MRRLRHLAGQHRTTSTNRLLGALLAFNAGAINAGGFLVVGMYTSHMTGFASMISDMLVLGSIMTELSEDMAMGEGEALTTYAVVLGIKPEDRAHFASVTQAHFDEIFSSADVTAEQVHAATLAVLKADARLAQYVEQA